MLHLYRSLLAGYEKEVRPAYRHDYPINVTFVFSLTQIIDVDERNQILTTNAWVHQHWFDYKLVWDPRLHGNLTRIHVPNEKIWRPDVILYNNADSQYTKSVMSTDVVVNYLGTVSWSIAAIFKSFCPLDVQHYPFDRQTCTLNYGSWAYDGSKIDLVLASKEGHITYEIDRLVGFIDFFLFQVFNLILPCVLISGIALLGFYMPSDSGEKVTLDQSTDRVVIYSGIYYIVTIFLVSLGTAMTVLTLNIHHQGVHGSGVPPFIQMIAFRFLARMLFVRIDPFHSITQHVRYLYQVCRHVTIIFLFVLFSRNSQQWRLSSPYMVTEYKPIPS
ncbi:Neurotransmitter-gated ion-channel ligand binding domain protein [Dictyocaulus viviparus]|uniref:Neurotransmitter-gated ion-channel ligand binding domain protein n=1 Tax=Dictyocaulus viviparus TaxID=29172 RepID=A0A0D8XYL8_DICVI|nr:Neurotransmitter-gated ion-channel ligand binding domain protein [Dictyocaulus viviparus]